MNVTNEERMVNEKFLIGMMRITETWTWVDTMETYHFENNKIIPATVKGWTDLKNIIRPAFFDIFVKEPKK